MGRGVGGRGVATTGGFVGVGVAGRGVTVGAGVTGAGEADGGVRLGNGVTVGAADGLAGGADGEADGATALALQAARATIAISEAASTRRVLDIADSEVLVVEMAFDPTSRRVHLRS